MTKNKFFIGQRVKVEIEEGTKFVGTIEHISATDNEPDTVAVYEFNDVVVQCDEKTELKFDPEDRKWWLDGWTDLNSAISCLEYEIKEVLS